MMRSGRAGLPRWFDQALGLAGNGGCHAVLVASLPSDGTAVARIGDQGASGGLSSIGVDMRGLRGEKLGAVPVLPMVLYHGTAPWTGALAFQDLLAPAPPGLERYQPRFHYLLLDEERYPPTALAGSENLAAALFRLDRSRSYDELQAVVDDLLAWLATPQQRSLRRAFGIWLRRVFLRRRLPGVIIPEIDDLGEVKAMLAERWKRCARGETARRVLVGNET